MVNSRARRAPSARQSAASRRNIAKAHLSRIRLREPRSAGRARPNRKPQQRNLLKGMVR